MGYVDLGEDITDGAYVLDDDFDAARGVVVVVVVGCGGGGGAVVVCCNGSGRGTTSNAANTIPGVDNEVAP